MSVRVLFVFSIAMHHPVTYFVFIDTKETTDGQDPIYFDCTMCFFFGILFLEFPATDAVRYVMLIYINTDVKCVLEISLQRQFVSVCFLYW